MTWHVAQIPYFVSVSLLTNSSVPPTGLTNSMFMPPGSLVVETTSGPNEVSMPLCGYYGPFGAVFGHHSYVFSYSQVCDDDVARWCTKCDSWCVFWVENILLSCNETLFLTSLTVVHYLLIVSNKQHFGGEKLDHDRATLLALLADKFYTQLHPNRPSVKVTVLWCCDSNSLWSKSAAVCEVRGVRRGRELRNRIYQQCCCWNFGWH